MKIIVLTGSTAGNLAGMGDIEINIPSHDTQRIQECHLLVEHILCEMVEANYKWPIYFLTLTMENKQKIDIKG